MPATHPIIAAHLSVGYGHRAVLTDINLTLAQSTLTCLIGPNGAGKSTLLRTLAGYQPPMAGRMLIGGLNLQTLTAGERAQVVSVVLTDRIDAVALSVTEIVAMGRAPYTGLLGTTTAADRLMVAQALEMVAAAPSFVPSVEAWARAALEVRDRWPDGAPSLGIPTWHYGHEPPNAFATAIAKYFRNAVREAVLLRIASAGIVFLPGAAGTVQEVFQDACENYYAEPGARAPMVLVGRRHWTETLPAWPLLHPMQTAGYKVADLRPSTSAAGTQQQRSAYSPAPQERASATA